MKKRPLATISFILITITITIMAPIFDNSIYGVNGHPTEWMSFIPSSPLRYFGLGFITSPFIHFSFEHLVVNLFFLIPIAMIIERKKSAIYFATVFSIIHLQVLITLIIIDHFYSLEGRAFLGSSHIIFGLYSYWSLKNRSYGLLLVTIMTLGIGLWGTQGLLTHASHVLGFIAGLTILIFDRLQRHKEKSERLSP